MIRAYHRLQRTGLDSLSEKELNEICDRLKKLNHPQPKVSVVLIAHNEEHNLVGCLASLSHSKVSFPMEIIVVDNASTDGTKSSIARFGLDEVYEARKGYGFARQAGMNAAKGEIIVTGDADTLYESHWVSNMAEVFEDSQVSCAYSFHSLLDEKDRYGLGLKLYQWAKNISWTLKHRKRPQMNCGGASMAFRKKDALEVGGYKANGDRWEDGNLALALAALGRITLVKSRRPMVFTSARRVTADGNLFNAFLKRFFYRLRHLDSFLFSQREK